MCGVCLGGYYYLLWSRGYFLIAYRYALTPHLVGLRGAKNRSSGSLFQSHLAVVVGSLGPRGSYILSRLRPLSSPRQPKLGKEALQEYTMGYIQLESVVDK